MTHEMITPEKLRDLASILRANLGPHSPHPEAMELAAKEIEVLRFTAEASVKLAQRASEQSVRDRELMHGMQVAGTEQHNKLVAYRINRDELRAHVIRRIEEEYPAVTDDDDTTRARIEFATSRDIIELIKST